MILKVNISSFVGLNSLCHFVYNENFSRKENERNKALTFNAMSPETPVRTYPKNTNVFERNIVKKLSYSHM